MGKEITQYYRYNVDQVISELGSSANGLTFRQAQYRLKNSNTNIFQKVKHLNKLSSLILQFKNAIVLMLIGLSLLSILSGFDKLAAVLLFTAVVNISVMWHRASAAQNLAEKLHKFTGSSATVVRDRKAGVVSSSNLALGDMVTVKENEYVPADLRVVSEKNLIADDRIVSGDITPNKKFSRVINDPVPINDQDNLLFAGTKIIGGSGRGIVIAVGKDTQLAKLILANKEIVSNKVKLQKYINARTNLLLQVCLVLIALTAATALYARLDFHSTVYFIIALSASIMPNNLMLSVYGLVSRIVRKTYNFLSINSKRSSSLDGLDKKDLIALNSAIFIQNSLDMQSQNIKAFRRSFFNIANIFRNVISTNVSEAAVVVTGLFTQIYYNVPLAITATQILAIDLAIMIWPLAALGWDSRSETYKEDSDEPSKKILNKRVTSEVTLYGLLVAALAFAGFLMFFSRRHITPVYISSTSLVYQQAVTLTMLVIILCQYINLLILRSRKNKKFLTNYLWQNKKFLIASIFSLFILINILYNPLLTRLLSTQPLSFSDWLSAILLTLIYSMVVLFFRHTKKHTRNEVIKLHKQINSRKASGSLPV